MRRDAGFTLIEILVALAIAALALAALFEAFAGGLRSARVVEGQAASVLLARSLADRVGRDIALMPGEQSGETADGGRWTVRIEPAALTLDIDAAQSPVVPYDVVVTAAATGGAPFTLTLFRLAPAAGLVEPEQ